MSSSVPQTFMVFQVLIFSQVVFGALDTLPTDTAYIQKPLRHTAADELQPTVPITNTQNDHQARLGFVTYGNDVQGTQGAASVTPLKIELGGVFLGTLIGLGLVLLAPKVSELFSHHPTSGQYHGSYSRSEDQNIMTGFTKVMTKIDETLQENNIDSMSCLERAACTYVQSGHRETTFLGANSSHSLLNFVIDGSKLKTALDRGLNGENCSVAYPQCSFSKNTLVSGIRSLIASNAL